MEICDYFSNQAFKALIKEVNLTPKPGLVDRNNTGSHTDMDLETFYDSAKAISHYFKNYFLLGYHHLGSEQELFEKVREEGKKAEAKMLKATKGVNTHKGANFSFALLLSSLGKFEKNHLKKKLTKDEIENVLSDVKMMCENLSNKDLVNLQTKKKLTNGEKLFLKKGIKGVRGEAESGYLSLSQVLLPSFEKNKKLSEEERYLRGLVELMSEVEDSNVYHRGNENGIFLVKNEANRIRKNNYQKEEFLKQLVFFDKKLIKKNLSPGGSADLLALGIFLDSVQVD